MFFCKELKLIDFIGKYEKFTWLKSFPMIQRKRCNITSTLSKETWMSGSLQVTHASISPFLE